MKIKTVAILGTLTLIISASGVGYYSQYKKHGIPEQEKIVYLNPDWASDNFDSNIKKCKKDDAIACRRAAEFFDWSILFLEKKFLSEKDKIKLEKNKENKMHLLNKACDLQEPTACKLIAYELEKDLNNNFNAEKFELLKELKDKAFKYADYQCRLKTQYTQDYCNEAAYYAAKHYPNKILSPEDEQYYTERACFFGNGLSCGSLLFTAIDDRGKAETDRDLSARAGQALVKACEESSNEAARWSCKFAADLFDHYNDHRTAEEMYLKSCKLDNSDACFSIGRYYLEGNFVRQDKQKAEKYLDIACKNDIPDACQLLKNL